MPVLFEIETDEPFFHVAFEIDLPVLVRQPAEEIVWLDVPDLRQLAPEIGREPVGVPRSSTGTVESACVVPTKTLCDHGTMAALEKYGDCCVLTTSSISTFAASCRPTIRVPAIEPVTSSASATSTLLPPRRTSLSALTVT